MRPRRRQTGAVVAIVLVVLVLVLLTWAATYLVSRLASSTGERGTTETRMAAAAVALEQFASSAARLPCPAAPTLDTGEEVRDAGLALCTYPGGTLPWKTIGMRREDSFDAWGRKLSYRVYTGDAAGNGSLARDQGASMVACDTVEPMPAIPATKLCNADADPYLRNTTPALFLAGKGLAVTDFGTARSDIAYVLISHGSSGLGGYSTSGARRELPLGDERDNTQDSATFVAKAFSDPDTSVTSNAHFDDVLYFRSISEMVKNANLSARNWPDAGGVFDRPTVAAAVGVEAASLGADTGVASIDFGTFSASGFTGAGTVASNISFDESYGGVGGIGIYGGTGNLMWSSANDLLRFQLDEKMSKFAITLNHFGKVGGFFTERAQLTFYNDGVFQATHVKSACAASDGGLASYSIDVGVLFNRVDVKPLDATFFFFSIPTGMLVSEFIACRASVTSCSTSLALQYPASICP